MKRGDKNGFTIIEVSLVLAIAGLIFLMIFIALPALRRTQRDSTRRDDMMVFLKELKSFQTNNRGALPTGTGAYNWPVANSIPASTWGGFFRDYMGENFVDPDGVHYNLAVANCIASATEDECRADGLGDQLNDHLNRLSDLAFPNGYKLIVITQATCEGEKPIKVSNPRKVAVLYRLEGAGTYCGNT